MLKGTLPNIFAAELLQVGNARIQVRVGLVLSQLHLLFLRLLILCIRKGEGNIIEVERHSLHSAGIHRTRGRKLRRSSVRVNIIGVSGVRLFFSELHWSSVRVIIIGPRSFLSELHWSSVRVIISGVRPFFSFMSSTTFSTILPRRLQKEPKQSDMDQAAHTHTLDKKIIE